MKVAIATDHNGVNIKKEIIKYLNNQNIETIDLSEHNSAVDDYPLYAFEVGKAVSSKKADYGILLCGTGIGMSIAANKFRGIMCAKVDNSDEARLAKEHNHANVISFSEKKTMWEIKDIVDAYLKATPLEGERYLRRIEEIKDIEKKRKY